MRIAKLLYRQTRTTSDIEDLKVEERKYGMVEQIGLEPRSYIVCTSRGSYRSNRLVLVPAPIKEGKLVVNSGLCYP
ncbi:hypothetical protein PR048_007144 [Dryococelus australis]|uniref:Uncharacterized protein n=1 Tax=Dryococelus australis TaxID=614101 RepID=A0ABQ9IE50_9NEOP|nr:hypothetical protein PR048_007144 [Dryococelus australis]